MRTIVLVGYPGGSAVLSRPPRQAFQAALMDAIPSVPHLADLPAAIEAGLAYGTLPPGLPYPLLSHDVRRPFLFLIEDTHLLARGPDGFHAATVRKMARAAAFVGLVPGAPDRAFYGAAIATALDRKRPAVLVETQAQERDAWLRWLARYARVPIEVCAVPGAVA
jgi:hypothetical protein